MFSKLRLRKSIAYLLIWLQLLTPGLSLLPVIARASEPADMQSTIQGLNALILNDATPAQTSPQPNVPSVSPSIQSDATVPTRDFSDYFHVQAPDPVSSPAVTGLPSLSSPQASSAETTSALPQGAGNDAQEHRLASGASQMGSLLSQDNTTDATINYARSIGEGLINQQVNEWLNQYGNAKVSLGNHKNLSGDLLLPLAETDQSLVFSQLGMRTNQDRNTVNLGVGYRQYINDWMLGINGFYDYDYTGENKRIGVGTEAWTDYLKLAANGYLRQTNWHQSKLGSMEDYDERPANGFDLRANAYLPSWPNLGGSLKYEQYFGKGVSMAESASPDSLKDSPVVVTAGIDYTPFPLMTLSAKRSVGDSNATNVGVDFTYRFGVPWLRQIDPDAVGLMRSLVGSKYDFVDRNYNIVMQYRKQELITISLPATTTAQAAETVPVTLTVSKAKYGLKSVSWDVDPLLTARGGRYQQVSPTELRVTLPAYVFGQRASAAQNYTISAIATDNHGNQSNTAETVIGVIPSENTVSSLTISPDDRVLTVNASRGYTITALVTDGKGAPLASQSLTFSVTGLVDAAGRPGTTLSQPDGSLTDSRQITLTTGADGKASALLFSTVAGQGTVTATMDNGNSNSGRVSFTADVATAEVATLVVVDDNATADGEATNSVLMTVEDKFGNPISGADVYLTASNGARIASVVTTDEQGRATAGLTNTKSGTSTVTASLNGSQKEASVTFGVGRPAQDTSSIRTDRSDYTAGDDMTVSVVLSDAQNNAITGQAGMLTSGAVTVPHASVKATGGWTEDTRSPGTYTRLYVANTMSENQTATLSLTGWSTSSNPYNIIANIRQAVVDSIEVVDNNAEADGTAMNSVRVTVRDDYNNLVNGAVVSLSAGNGALIAASGTTGQEGTILATLTSDRAGMSEVTASLNGSSQSTRVSFGVGQPVRASSTIATDKTTYTSGGEIRVTVVLKDQKQNAVTGLDSARLNGMVTVPNADAGTANNWAETGITGSYTGTYVARLAGENLTAILTVSDGDNRSAAYSIEAGAPVLVNSSITRNSDSYVSGDNITVTVTLKDGNTTPNPVKGLDSATLAGMVSVDNAEAVSTSDWAEAADNPGTYTGIYVAKTVGTGLRATLSIDGADKTSAVYGITAGAAIPAGSGIVTDMTRYTAGAEMVVTVTLRDAQGNAVTGEASALEATTKVPNTTVKSASWKDNHDGSYERTYTASTVGSDLKASLQLSSWSAESQSAAYAITQGAPVQTGGTITTNATTYVAGAEMTVTVILRDAEGNGVTGAADSLADTTTVQHATTNPGSSWTETSEGNYERTYTATTVGSDLKASLQLNGWTTASESAAYAITQGAPVQTGGTITTNATSYVAGADMTVTVTLRDAQGNGVVGEVNAVAAGTTVPSASVKPGSSWTETSGGSYERTYTATTVGSNLKASLQLSAWDAASESAAYAITQGAPVQTGGTIATNATSYVAGADMTVTVTLRDAEGNGVSGLAGSLTDSTARVTNATAKSDSWTETSGGSYERTYTATTVGSNLKASLQLSAWDAASESAAYAITQGAPVQTGGTITTNATSYEAGADMTVTVTLKDAEGNGVTGAADSLADTTTVQHATAKPGSSWTENSGGTYQRIYTATTVGSNLKASLQLSAWDAASESAVYAITQGTPVQTGGAITTNATSYEAGADMTVTVTLKDAEGNGVSGLAGSLADTTTVQHATAKPGSSWTENSGGTYQRIYTATTVGSNLKASLQLSAWDAASESAAYAITQGAPVQTGGTIATNATSYVAGADMTVTVTLRDAQGNGVVGEVNAVEAGTTVPSATVKSGSSWADNQDGTYERTYTATTVGSNLKASLQLSDWGAASQSAVYAITQGAPVQTGGTIATDTTSYEAGADMTVTVTLRDAQGNGVVGEVNAVAAGTTVPSASVKSGSNWADNQDGTYKRTYTATTVGSNLKASLQLSDWDAASESAAYAITQGAPVQTGGTIATNATSYVAGADMTVTVTLKDAEGNGVTGAADSLADTTTVQSATAKSGSWTDNQDGTYERTYTATTVGSNLKASLQLSDWDAASESAAYAITQGAPVQTGGTIATDAKRYVAGAEMTITVTLRDAQGNGVVGEVDAVAAGTTVQSATAKAGSSWTEKSVGTYERTYIANTVGTDLTASLQLGSWATASVSATYAITQDSVVQKGSGIATNASRYIAGAEMTVTVTLKDAQGNGVIGEEDTLTNTTTVQSATAKPGSNWTDNHDGTYERIYIANTVGTDLKASLRLSNWGTASESAAYAITQGSVVQKGSTITTDATRYMAGTEMTVTVTLFDAQGNGVTGEKISLTDTTARVQNATAKPGSSWTDNNDGTYERTYIASEVGTDLKASLQLSSWDSASQSAVYAITQGAPVQTGGTIATNATSYVAGADMTVTVTLRDAQGNGVVGEVDAVAAGTTVPSASVKSGSNWADNQDGTYKRTYTATTVGSNLKASLQLSAWDAASESAAYAITQGAPVQTGGTIATNATSYVAGADMTVTVTLKDAEGNGVTGAADSLADTTTVQSATAKPGSSWTENSGGTYQRIYTATTVGSNLKASLQLSDWDAASESAAYAITQGAPVQTGGTIATNATSYVAGADMTVTVTLRDAQGNGVVGEVNAVEAGTTVPSATVKSGSWTDNQDGTYKRTYTATTVGSNLKASLQLSAWDAASESAVYAITQGAPVQTGGTIATDTTSYEAGADMTVTVTLRDAQGNGVVGEVNAVEAGTTVPSASVKSGSNWTDNQDGTYERTYTATTVGSNLKASLQLSDWDAASESAAYAITQGAPVQTGGTIATNATSYEAGADMTVTVTLRDAQGNGVVGEVNAVEAGTTVPSASVKSGSNWADNQDGTYERTYTATTVGSNLKASLQLSDWGAASQSAVYAITQGAPVQTGGTITTNATSYVAGADMTVTVTLRDAQGNGVVGEVDAVAAGTTVPSASVKSGSNWADNQDGTYERTYTATTVGSNLKASLQLSDWDAASESAAYAITQGAPVQTGGTIATNATSYVAGADMTVTVTLRDAQGNGVVGEVDAVAAGTTVPSASVKSGSNWADNQDGTYKRTYTATTVGSNLKASLQLSAWDAASESAAYAITQGAPVQTGGTIATNATSYVAGADMTVTVTLRDAQGNGVVGEVNAVEAGTTVPSASVKSGSSWTDNLDGTYERTYTATTVGSNLKASLQLSAWDAASESAAYAITANKTETHIVLNWVNNDKLVIANNKDLNVIQGQITDNYGNVISDASIKLTLPSGVSLSSGGTVVRSDSNGNIDFSIFSSISGEVSITAKSTESSDASSTAVATYFSPETIDLIINFTN